MTDPKPTEQMPESMPLHVKQQHKLVSDAEIEDVWGNANFGKNANKRIIIADTLLKYASGYSSGYTARSICIELGLLTTRSKSLKLNLTAKGKKVMFWTLSPDHLRHAPALTPPPAASEKGQGFGIQWTVSTLR